MFRFEHKEYLMLLLIIPFLAAILVFQLLQKETGFEKDWRPTADFHPDA